MSTKNEPTIHPMRLWLRTASPAQRQRAADLSGTTVNYFHQIAACRREPGCCLAFAIEDALAVLHEESEGVLPLVSARQIATALTLGGL